MEKESAPPRSNAASTVIVMTSTLVSRLLGFVRVAVVGAIFGASGEADVLNLVFNIPNNLRKLLAEGALSSAFVPVLSRSHVEDRSGERARGIVRRLIGFQIVALTPIIALVVIAPHRTIGVLLDFPEPARQLLAGDLFRYFIWYTLFVSLSAVLMGALNAQREFTVPAVAPLLFSVAVISSVVTLHRAIGVYAMVVGVLMGGVLQFAVQVPAIIARRYTLWPSFTFRDPHFRRILARWLPVLSTSSVFAINQQVALYFASGLPDGSGSAMTNALVFWQLPFGIFATAITTVLFPAMSRHYAGGETRQLHRTLLNGVRALVLLMVPCGVGLIALGYPLIAVALQRGAFSAAATGLSARVLSGYSVGLLSVAAFTFLQRFFYACDNYRTPLVIAVVVVVIDIGLSLVLKETALGVVGLAIANSLAFTVGLVLFLSRIYHNIERAWWRALRRDLVRALFASACAVGALALLQVAWRGIGLEARYHGGSSLVTLLFLLVDGAVPLATLLAAYRLVGVRPREVMRARVSEV